MGVNQGYAESLVLREASSHRLYLETASDGGIQTPFFTFKKKGMWFAQGVEPLNMIRRLKE
ncbi:hypothetical protein GCM10011379_08200 [Filimonas zeae]|uniref:Uncharacterized protein n=1 Tax=Filimonas zeae TaxID=1737353 RepID=A0A917MRV3_9BACT|nr:hypothetical protein GCM10011379_08200 [Filimonas zeae]